MKFEEYRKQLQSILDELKNHSIAAEIRGDNAASFIFAEKENRAIEIYQSENKVVIEFWENERLQTEDEMDSSDIAAKSAIDWINNFAK